MNAPAYSAAWCEAKMGRQPSQAPAHLTRVLYIPHHDDTTAHLPIYEAGARYHEAVQDALLGSSAYKTKLNFMKTPEGVDMTDDVEYLADMRVAQPGSLQVHLNKRELGNWSPQIQLIMSPPTKDEFPVVQLRSENTMVKLETSFPIPESIRASKSIVHPYFALTVHSSGARLPWKLEWQIHPVQDGLLRYTLVRQDDAFGDTIYAIYHHKRWETSLALPYSEGILLLPQQNELEGMVVTSLLGILAQLRMQSTSSRKKRKESHLKKIMRLATPKLS